MNEFIPFEMERAMSKFEQEVQFNLSESGVHPMTLGALLEHSPVAMEQLLATEINYPHVNGIPRLRTNIAATYEGATRRNVLVTVGAIEANYIAIRTMLEPGDEIIDMQPNYKQIWGIAKNHGLVVKTFSLRPDSGWAPDLDELESKISDRTKLLAICNPNNPTGRILTRAEMERMVELASRHGAWILADEVYRGAERESDEVTPSFFGLYDKVIAIGSMSKAYGLPGLRLGWVAAPPDSLDQMWARHEYIAISASMLSNHLAALALDPEVRPKILARSRKYIRDGFPVFESWANSQSGAFTVTPPDASAVAFVKYHLDINSTEFSERLLAERGVLVVPGDHFDLDHHLRISFGLPHDFLNEALGRIAELVLELGGCKKT